MRLWHDDVRPPPDGWEWARTNDEAKLLLQTGAVEECSLDHDLGLHELDLADLEPEEQDELILRASWEKHRHGQHEETGLNLVHWMVATGMVPAVVRIHSWNPDGAEAMAAWLNHNGYDCIIDTYRKEG